MNKFLWSLFGIGDDEVEDLSRRGFLMGLGAAAVLTAARPKFFLPPIGGWKPAVADSVYQFGFTGWKNLNTVTMDYVMPILADNVFKSSPLFTALLVESPKAMRG